MIYAGPMWVGIAEMLRCALEASALEPAYAAVERRFQLASMPLPAIALLREGGFLCLLKVTDNQVLVVFDQV